MFANEYFQKKCLRQAKPMILSFDSGKIVAFTTSGSRTVADGIAFSLEKGQSLALIGETGSGKTMTALALMRLLPSNVKQTGGKIVFLGEDLLLKKNIVSILGKEIVYIPQSGADYLNPTATVKSQLFDQLKKNGVPKEKRLSEATNNLEKAGFGNPEEILKKRSFELSGGMAQRVAIALSLCSAPKLVVCDEATNGLNDDESATFVNKLNELFPDAAKLVITHDIRVANSCDKITVLCGGKVMENGDKNRVLSSPRHPYTRSLVRALTKNGMTPTPVLRAAQGDCPFFSRCAEADEKCLREIPFVIDENGGRRCVRD